MAVKRTGTVFKSSVKNKPLPRLFSALEKIGKPLFWLFLGLVYLLGYFLKFTSQKRQWILAKTKAIHLPHWRFPRLKLKIKPKIKKIRIKKPRVKKFKRIKITWPKLVLPRKKLTLILILFFLFSLLSYLSFNIFYGLPNPNKLANRDQAVSTKIYDRQGQLLYKIYRNQNRTLIKLEEIPLSVIQATIAVEDAEFYSHRGFSWKAIFRAAIKNLGGDKLYGGSTITQQLVKNALLTPERTWRRKVKEIVLSLLVENKFTKDEILQMYLNEVPYGSTAYGIEEASQLYLDKSAKELTLAQSALLAGLPASPTTYSPFGSYPEKAKERQEFVLYRMKQEGYISEEERKQAVEETIRLAPQRTDIKAPHFVMYIKELLAQKYGERMVEEGGLEVKTSLDLALQEEVQKIVQQEIDQLARLHITNGAALVTNPQTGEVLAMIGSKDYFNESIDGNVNVTLRPRQPGSSIKPVNYAVALQNGFTPATVISDTPITYQVAGQPPYSPKNYDNQFHGNVPLRIALASSYNVPAVKVLAAFGVNRMIEQGQKMGITTWNEPSRFGLSLTLGGGEVKMTDMAVAYGTLANLGGRVNLNPILEVKNYKGEILEKAPKEVSKEFALPSTIAYLLTNILSDPQARIPAFGPRSWLNIQGHSHVAVKTGTTQNLRDNWTIGYSPDYVTVVWVGNNDNTPMSYVASGVTGASPIWNKIMTLLLKDLPDKEFPAPEELKRVEICPMTGSLPCEGCGGKWEYFLTKDVPKNHCSPEKIKEMLISPTPTPNH
jgi:1A family penicillin-binding protein